MLEIASDNCRGSEATPCTELEKEEKVQLLKVKMATLTCATLQSDCHAVHLSPFELCHIVAQSCNLCWALACIILCCHAIMDVHDPDSSAMP